MRIRRVFGTFIDDGHLERDADDADQILRGNKRAKDGTNPERFTFTLIDQLREQINQ